MGNGKRLPYYGSLEIGEGLSYPNLTRAVIVIHGTLRNADYPFDSMVNSAKEAGQFGSTAIIAPHFQRRPRNSGDLNWLTSDSWRKGDLSTIQAKFWEKRYSSFTVMDKMIKEFSNRDLFPSLSQIVIVGHSAGGQYVQRYAAGARAENEVRSDVNIRYIVANPSSYMYLNEYRYSEKKRRYHKPNTLCRYNTYKYGMRKLNRYMRKEYSKSRIRSQYINRDVVYYIGTEDVQSAHLDKRCAANYQGKNRVDRGVKFFLHLNRYYRFNNHRLRFASGVAHSGWGMYNHSMGRSLIFN